MVPAPPITRRNRGPRVKKLQREVKETLNNRGFDQWAKAVRVDGIPGPMTFKMARLAGSMQGLPKPALRRIGRGKINRHDELILTHERRRTRGMKARDRKRRPAFNELRKEMKAPTEGVTTFDGVKVAAWLVPYLEEARRRGWQGTLVSGWRDPVYSEQLCISMCGAPSCPGQCAGRSSNHSGSVKPAGAIDVSDYTRFGQIMREIGAPIFNALGPADPVHFSATGR